MALPFQFSGSLKDVPLTEILQLLRTTQQTGCLSLTCRGGSGAIYLEKGAIVEAQSSHLSGRDAIKLLAVFNAGSFEFTIGNLAAFRSLMSDSTDALIELLDERRIEATQIRELIPQSHEVPFYLGGALPSNFELTASELAVAMQASSGTLSIEQLSERLSLDLLFVGYTVARFRAIGSIKFSDADKMPASPLSAPTTETSEPEPPATDTKPRYWRGRRIN